MYLGGVLAAVTEALLPGLCPHCGALLPGKDRGLCRGCWSKMVPLAGAACPRCGVPSDDPSLPCLDCVRTPPPQGATVIWGEHDGSLRTAVLSLKYGGRDDFSPRLGARLAAVVAAQPWGGTIDTVSFVPSHPLRRIRRPWAAAELLGREIAKCLERPFVPLLRRHGLRRQSGHSRAQRLELPSRSFSPSTAADGRYILLVDDVTTTGTTLRRAAATLKRAGAEAVFGAILALALDPRRMP
ncbi:MAG: ComF family protein [Thermoanaerobaculales bacterium]